jgi:two-component system, cell cycle response regulator DivK
VPAAVPLVLIVDDNERNRKLARDVLAAAGFRTQEAASAAEALALAGRHLPDVILMDLRLPDLDGDEAARKLAADTRTASIPVVALTSVRLEQEPGACFAGYLEKPIDIEAFPEQVRSFCRP